MKNVELIFLFLLLNVSTVFSQTDKQLNCQNFKTGTFEIYVDTLRIIIERNLEFQVERTILGNSKYKITWKNDCEYDTELIETDFNLFKDHIGRIYHTKITSTKDDKYAAP